MCVAGILRRYQPDYVPLERSGRGTAGHMVTLLSRSDLLTNGRWACLHARQQPWMTQTQRQGAAVADIMTIPTPSLGDRSYLVTDGAVAFVVDPQRDIDRVLALTASRGIAVTHVFETHIHNDYLTGGLALARATGAAYHLNAADAVAFDRVAIGDGDEVDVGTSMRVRVIATPGHTFTHLAYALEDAATGEVTAVFTGGSLLHGSTGRPDLLGAE